MGFPKLFAAMKRRLAKQRNDTSFDTLADDDDDAESWRGCLNATGTEDWNRIQEGQRMLQLSTSMWFGTDQGPFDMKDDERYELLYGRPIGVEDPVLEALRLQRHQIPGGIYVEPGRTAREPSGFTPYTSNDGMLPTHDVDGAARRLSQATSVEACGNESVPAQSGDSSSSDLAYSESRRLTNIESFQRKLQPSMSWHHRMTRFQCSDLTEAMQASAGLHKQAATPVVDWERPQTTTPTPTPKAPVNEASCRTSGSTVQVCQMGIPCEHDEEHIRHMAWRWRFTKRWCKEHTEPHAEMSRRDEMFAAALAGAPSGAWSQLLHNTSTDGGADRDTNTLTESMLFSDCGEDATTGLSATAGRWPQRGAGRASMDRAPGRLSTGRRPSTDSRASSRLDAAMVDRGLWQEGRIRGGAP